MRLYDGQYLDQTTGLYYLRARWYDPATDQFTSIDPDVAETGEPYAYAGDDPVNEGDPSGLSPGMPLNGECASEGNLWVPNNTSAAGGTCIPEPHQSVVGTVIGSIDTWVYAHRSLVATLGAIAVCAAPGIDLVGCGIATAAAFAVRVQQQGTSAGAFEGDAVDFVLTAVSFGLIATPAAISLGEAPDAVYSVLGIARSSVPEFSESAVAAQLLRLRLASPDAINVIIEQIAAALGHSRRNADEAYACS